MHLGYAAIKRVLSEKQVKKLFRRCVDLSRDTSLKESVVLWLRIQALRRTVGSSLKNLKQRYQQASLVAQMVKNHLQCGRPEFDPWVGKIPWREGMATHSSILAWRIPWTEEPGRLQSMGSQRVGHD